MHNNVHCYRTVYRLWVKFPLCFGYFVYIRGDGMSKREEMLAERVHRERYIKHRWDMGREFIHLGQVGRLKVSAGLYI